MSVTDDDDEVGKAGRRPAVVMMEKPSFAEYLADRLPFKLPSIPLPQTAKNLDRAVASVILCGADYGVAWAERRMKIKDAKADAEVKLIRKGAEVASLEIDNGDAGLAERAKLAAYGRIFQEQENRERIVEVAVKELEREPGNTDATDAINSDWLNAFSNSAAAVTNAQMQELWGRLLAGEIRKPGTFKLRTLQALTLVDTSEAKLIHQSMDLVVAGKALYVGPHHDRSLQFSELLELESAGVLQGVGSLVNLTIEVKPNRLEYIFFGGQQAIRLESTEQRIVKVENVCPLTPFGRELLHLAGVENPRGGIVEKVAREVVQDGLVVTWVNLIPIPNTDRSKIVELKQLYPKG